MRSSLYECRVMHHRFRPKQHRFVYGIFLLAVDLDELEVLHRSLQFFSLARRNVYSFREDDYLPINQPLHPPSPISVENPTNGVSRSVTPRGSSPDGLEAPPLVAPGLKGRVIAYLAQHHIDLTNGRVVLLTLPRVFGYLFNPVSFYFCYDCTGSPVATIAEVTNTFREVKPFLLGPETRQFPAAGSIKSEPSFCLRLPKNFYVSPYSAADLSFDFTLRPPTDRLALQIDDYSSEQRLLTSTLTGHSRPLTDAALLSATLRHPFVTLKIISLIHWQALRLFAKGIPWFRKTDQAEEQRELYRPHPSIARSP